MPQDHEGRHRPRHAFRENRLMRRRTALTLALCLVMAAIGARGAAGHVQVRPAEAAPADTTRFTLLVPNEEASPTVRVDLQIPDGVVPVAFSTTPAWTRAERRRADGSLAVVSWRGSLAAGEFVEFSFLATTPARDGPVAWPTVQVYRDGTIARWIGPPDSDEPAPVTEISDSVARQNAGGEGDEGGSPTVTAVASGEASATSTGDTLAVVAVAVAGLALAAAIAAIVLGRRRQSS